MTIGCVLSLLINYYCCAEIACGTFHLLLGRAEKCLKCRFIAERVFSIESLQLQFNCQYQLIVCQVGVLSSSAKQQAVSQTTQNNLRRHLIRDSSTLQVIFHLKLYYSSLPTNHPQVKLLLISHDTIKYSTGLIK